MIQYGRFFSIYRVIAGALLAPVVALAGCSDSGSAARLGSSDGQHPNAAQISEPYHIEITGSKDRWRVRYPDASGNSAREVALDAWNVHVPLRKDVVFILN